MRLAVHVCLAVLALGLVGCGPGGAWAALALVLAWVAALTLAGCSDSHTPAPDDAQVADAETDAGGTWERCCIDGRLSTCHCPAGVACNYGKGLIVCDDGVRCGHSFTGGFDDEERRRICGDDAGIGADAGIDAGGSWEPCCDEETGMVTTCFCPADTACNYGWFEICADGRCSYGPCPDAAAVSDAGAP